MHVFNIIMIVFDKQSKLKIKLKSMHTHTAFHKYVTRSIFL